jgi:predicted nucleic acid-binding Zn ribbon protein
MIDPRDLLNKDNEWVTRMVEDPIRKQQRRRRRKTFLLIAVLCIIALVVGAVIGWTFRI